MSPLRVRVVPNPKGLEFWGFGFFLRFLGVRVLGFLGFWGFRVFRVFRVLGFRVFRVLGSRGFLGVYPYRTAKVKTPRL